LTDWRPFCAFRGANSTGQGAAFLPLPKIHSVSLAIGIMRKAESRIDFPI
jgi:hypothetical protein